MRPVAGIFVGGASGRMGGRPKGLLRAPDTGESLVERLARVADAAGLDVVLVGAGVPYGAVLPGVQRLYDQPSGVGPLGGLGALCAYAGPRAAVALACDMPYVSSEVLALLVTGDWCGAVVAPRRAADGRYEPFMARYDPGRVGPALARSITGGVRSFQGLFAAVDVQELTLTTDQWACLRDWDVPGDVEAGSGPGT